MFVFEVSTSQALLQGHCAPGLAAALFPLEAEQGNHGWYISNSYQREGRVPKIFLSDQKLAEVFPETYATVQLRKKWARHLVEEVPECLNMWESF